MQNPLLEISVPTPSNGVVFVQGEENWLPSIKDQKTCTRRGCAAPRIRFRGLFSANQKSPECAFGYDTEKHKCLFTKWQNKLGK
jgi:hypothetical protein